MVIEPGCLASAERRMMLSDDFVDGHGLFDCGIQREQGRLSSKSKNILDAQGSRLGPSRLFGRAKAY